MAIQTFLLVGLFLAWAVFLFGGFGLGRLDPTGTYRLPRWARLASSLALVGAGWGWVWLAQTSGYGREVSLLIAAGITLGCVGDFFMAGLVPVKEPTLGGIVSFGLGHLAYIAALFVAAFQYPADFLRETPFIWIVWYFAGVGGWYLVVWRGHRATGLHLAALPYTLLLTTTAAAATALAWQWGAFWPVAIGATLFLLSDLLLAAQLFNALHFRSIGDTVWLLYGPAQALIVFGAGLAYHL